MGGNVAGQKFNLQNSPFMKAQDSINSSGNVGLAAMYEQRQRGGGNVFSTLTGN
jgi:hypothetical protein